MQLLEYVRPLVQTTAAAYAAERHYSPEWQRWVCRMLRLALAIRDADGDDLVREEALDDLPHFADAAAEVLRRTGLLRPRPAHRPAATAPSRPWSLTLSGWTGPPRPLATAVQVQWEAEAGLRALHRSTPLEDQATWQPALHASERAVALEQPTRVVERGLGIEL